MYLYYFLVDATRMKNSRFRSNIGVLEIIFTLRAVMYGPSARKGVLFARRALGLYLLFMLEHTLQM